MDTVPSDSELAGGDRILVYAIASGDMWHSDVGERVIYLQREPQKGLYLQGEIPERGPGSRANLREMLLEYCGGCEGCRGESITAEHDCQFADRLGSRLLARIQELLPAAPTVDRVAVAMEIILNSMGVPFRREASADGLRYELEKPPLADPGRRGMQTWEPLARRAFVALSSLVVQEAAPDYVFVPPSEPETNVLWIKPISPDRQP